MMGKLESALAAKFKNSLTGAGSAQDGDSTINQSLNMSAMHTMGRGASAAPALPRGPP